MGVTIELQNLGDVQLCREIAVLLEHSLQRPAERPARVGQWIASGGELGSARGRTTWIRTALYALSRRWRNEPAVIRTLVLKLVPPA
jgi:hypothetical protein